MRAAQGARALGALVPALGLSNKAVYAGDAEPSAAGLAQGPAFPEGPDLAPAAAPRAVAGAPLEEHLGQSTLWPEVHKLYGHAGELSALAADPHGAFVASACRVRSDDGVTCSMRLCRLCRRQDWTPASRYGNAHTLHAPYTHMLLLGVPKTQTLSHVKLPLRRRSRRALRRCGCGTRPRGRPRGRRWRRTR